MPFNEAVHISHPLKRVMDKIQKPMEEKCMNTEARQIAEAYLEKPAMHSAQDLKLASEVVALESDLKDAEANFEGAAGRVRRLEARCALLQEYYEANEACAEGNLALANLDRLDAARAALTENGGQSL